MKINNYRIILLFLVSFMLAGCSNEIISNPIATLAFMAISQSHISGNVPDKKEFDEFLKRDLKAYFSKKHGDDISVDYELYRDFPAQVGVSYPKFYAWVVVKKGDEVIEEGAAKLAAIDKTEFDVYDYFNSEQLKEKIKNEERPKKSDEPQSFQNIDLHNIYMVFPEDVIKKIKTKLGI